MANTILTQFSKQNLGQFSKHNPSFNSKIQHNLSVSKHNHGFRIQKHDPKTNMYIKSWSIFCAKESPRPPSLVDYLREHWKSWILGPILTILLSIIARGRWGPLLLVTDKVEEIIEQVEYVVIIVEKVSEKVDKMAEGARKKLPKGKRRAVVEFVENAAEDMEKIAQNAEDALEKVENMEKKLESLLESPTRHHENQSTESKDKK